MTTDLNTLRVETRQLVRHATERYSDAIAFEGARLGLRDIGAIPPWAWGDLAWSGDWRKGWTWALDERVTEAKWARDAMGDIASTLLQIAADYEHTDIRAELDLGQINADLRPYADVVGARSTATYHPGGLGDLPPHYEGGGGKGHMQREGRPDVVYPSGDPRWNKLAHEPAEPDLADYVALDSRDYNAVTGERVRHYERISRGGVPGGENDGLDNFIREHHRTLLELEGIIDALGQGNRKPLSDIIVRAWRSSPSIIRNRTDLLGSVADAYGAISSDMSSADRTLKAYWDSPAAGIYYIHADTIQKYIGSKSAGDSIAGEVAWLAAEGKKAANCVQGLRIAYANLGYDRIGELMDKLKAYKDAVASAFSSCMSAEKSLLAAIDNFVNLLVAEEKSALAVGQGLLKIEDQVRKEGPDFDSRLHSATRPPFTAVGNDAWRQASGWKVNPYHPPQ